MQPINFFFFQGKFRWWELGHYEITSSPSCTSAFENHQEGSQAEGRLWLRDQLSEERVQHLGRLPALPLYLCCDCCSTFQWKILLLHWQEQGGCKYVPVSTEYSNHLNTEHRKVWVFSIQMAKSHDLVDHSNRGQFGPLTGFFQSGFQTTIWIPDHLTTGHKSTIQILDYSGIQMVTENMVTVKSILDIQPFCVRHKASYIE